MRLGFSLIILITVTNIAFAKNIKLKNFEVGCNYFQNIVKLISVSDNIVDGCTEYSTGGKSARILRTRNTPKKNKKYSKALLIKYIDTRCESYNFWIAR